MCRRLSLSFVPGSALNNRAMPFDTRYGSVAVAGDTMLERSPRHGKPHASICIHGVSDCRLKASLLAGKAV